jgi:predicted RNase H-like HicB family nuclease
MKFLVTLDRDEAGFIVADCPSLPGCLSQGRTEAEAIANIKEAIEVSLKTRQEHGIPTKIEVAEIEVEISS